MNSKLHMQDDCDPNNQPSASATYVSNGNAYGSRTDIKLSFKRIKQETHDESESFWAVGSSFDKSIPLNDVKREPDEQFENNLSYKDEHLNGDDNVRAGILEQEYYRKFGENNNFETSIKRELYETFEDKDDYFEEVNDHYREDNNTSGFGSLTADDQQNIEYQEIKLEKRTSEPEIIKPASNNKPPKYLCNHCAYSPSSKKSLNKHLRIHEGQIQWHRCDKCNYKSRQKGHLRRHGLSHQDLSECSKIFVCAICQYKFKQKCTLRRHILDIHGSHKKGSKPHPDYLPVFNCEECSYSSIRRSLFTAHLDKHKDPKDVSNLYICDICKFSTKYRRNLRVHLETHREKADKTIYECKICNFRSRLHYCLKRHLLSKKHLKVVGKLKEYCPREMRMKQEECGEELNVEEEFIKIEHNELKLEVYDEIENIKEENEDHVRVKVEAEADIYFS